MGSLRQRDIVIRKMYRQDLPAAMQLCMPGWTTNHFVKAMKKCTVVVLAQEYEDDDDQQEIFAVIIYTYIPKKKQFTVLKLFVKKEMRRKGIGTMLLTYLKNEALEENDRIRIIVRGKDVSAHWFLRHNEFITIKIIPNHYHLEDPTDDGDLMEYTEYNKTPVLIVSHRLKKYL